MKCIYKIKFVVVKRKTLLILFNKFLKILKKFFNWKKTFKNLSYRKYIQIKKFLYFFFFFNNCFWWNKMCYWNWSFLKIIRLNIPKNIGNENEEILWWVWRKSVFHKNFCFETSKTNCDQKFGKEEDEKTFGILFL